MKRKKREMGQYKNQQKRCKEYKPMRSQLFCDSSQLKGQGRLKFDDDELFFMYQHYKVDSNGKKKLREQNTFLTTCRCLETET